MKFRLFTCCLIVCSCLAFKPALAQAIAEKEELFKPHQSIGLVLGHAHVFEGRDDEGKKKVLALPLWGIDYNYQFHPKWAVGLHTDIILERFEVKKTFESEGEIIERSYPVAPAIMCMYKANKHWNFSIGAGAEFEKEESFFLNRAAVEYSAEIAKGWEVFGALNYDFKWKAYDTWVIGIGISKAFGKHH